MLKSSCSDEDKGIIYSNRVLIGNWFESSKLEEHKLNNFLEQMKNGDLMLARYRKMTQNICRPAVLTQAPVSINFGSKISLLAPHAPATDPPEENKKGLLLGGRLTSNDIQYSQELVDGCTVVGLPDLEPSERSAFVLSSADYCNRNDECLKYNQEFMLAVSASLEEGKKPLYLRYDRNPIPGLCGMYSLYLSEHPVRNARWRVLPVQRPNITRFEMEGEIVKVNSDIVINHCSTNINLGMSNFWAIGFYGKVCAPIMKTCLDIYGRELVNNIWQIYTPIDKSADHNAEGSK